MRKLLTILILISALSTRAQSHLPIGSLGYGYFPGQSFMPGISQPFIPFSSQSAPSRDSGRVNHKLQWTHFADLSAGYMFFNGGGMSYLSATAGLALIRPLNNNVSAFAAVSATPTMFSLNQLNTGGFNAPGYKPYNLGVNAAVQAGLMYTNDAKTFSISGSFGVERGSYPVYPYNRPAPRK